MLEIDGGKEYNYIEMKYMIGNYTKKRLNQKIVIDVNILSYVQVN